MIDDSLPESIGQEVVMPSALTPKQEELCQKLDDFHAQYDLQVRPSDMFRGAIIASSMANRSNPDWMSQAANSLREILYPFLSPEVKSVPSKQIALTAYGSVNISPNLFRKIGVAYNALNVLTHHGCNQQKDDIDYSTFTGEDFDKLLVNFEDTMLEALFRQIDVHEEYDDIIKIGPDAMQSLDL